MEVLKNNFEVHLQSFKDSLLVADFLSIDAEFSGLTPSVQDRIDIFDTMQRRYEKIKSSASQFMVFQVGISLFIWSKANKRYIAKPFNFYVFPRTSSSFPSLDRPFLSQPSSLEFLAQNKFDFNKWVQQGVPYVNRENESFLRSKIVANDDSSEIPIDDRNRIFVEDAMKQVHNWLQQGGNQSLSIPTPTSYHKRLIHQETKKRFNGFISTTSTRTAVDLLRLTEEQRNETLSRSDQLSQKLDTHIGFRHVMDAIAASEKPVIGHNMFLDTCLLYRQFNGQLPETLDEFKKNIKTWMPHLYDTKYLTCKSATLSKLLTITNLESIHEEVCKPEFAWPQVDFAEGFDSYSTQEDRYHEAGYDAYITGLAFLKMVGKIQEWKENRQIEFSSTILQETENKVFIMRSSVPYLDLGSGEEASELKNVYLLYGFPSSWKTSNIYNALKDVGQVTLKWLDDSRCLVMVRDEKKLPIISEILEKQTKLESPEFKLEKMNDLSILDQVSSNRSTTANPNKNPVTETDDVRLATSKTKRKRVDSDSEEPLAKMAKNSKNNQSCIVQ